MFIVRALIILTLIVVIFGGSAYFSYELYYKPQKLDREDRQTQRVKQSVAPPDFSLPAYQKAVQLQHSGDAAGACSALAEFLKNYPNSPELSQATHLLGDLNAQRFFSPAADEDKIAYTVGHGDSLAKIATKLKTNAELIYRVNNMDSIALQIGDQLFIPQPQITITVDHKAKTVTLTNHGKFFKQYKALSVKAPHTGASIKVIDKVAVVGDKRVAFGQKEYVGSERSILVSGGVVIRGVPAGTQGPLPAGVVVNSDDMDEIFLLASRGTLVTIQ